MRLLTAEKLLEILRESSSTSFGSGLVGACRGDLTEVVIDDALDLVQITKRVNQYCLGPDRALAIPASSLEKE